MPATAFSGELYRHFAPRYGPLDGDGARRQGGRWNPPDSFPTLYTGTSLETVDAEFARAAARAGLSPSAFLPRELAVIRVRLERVLDVRVARVPAALGVTVSQITADDVSTPQAIGEAANQLGFEAIIAPSATTVGEAVAVLLMNRSADRPSRSSNDGHIDRRRLGH